MEISATFAGQFLLICGVVFGIVSYYLGRRKTQTPVLTGVLGFVLSLIPIFGIIYVIVLVLKMDVIPIEISKH